MLHRRQVGRMCAIVVISFALQNGAGANEAGALTDGSDTALTGAVVFDGVPTTATITVIAWPTSPELEGLEEGETVGTKLVDRFETDKDGRFSVVVDPAQLDSSQRGRDGQVDLELVVQAGSRQATWFTSVVERQVEPAAITNERARSAWAPATSPTDGPQEVQFDLANGIVDVGQVVFAVDDSEPASKAKAEVPSINQLAVLDIEKSLSVAGEFEPYACPWTAGTFHYDITERFANVFAWSGAKGIVVFESGSSHTLGIALKSGSTWSASGTGTISTSSGAEANNVVNARAVNKVNYRDYTNCANHVQRRPVSFFALLPGGSFPQVSHTNFAYCGSSTYAPAQKIWKTKGKNATFSTGVSLGPISVSAQSGWTQQTKLTWSITQTTKVCGSTAVGWVESPELDARKA